MNYTEFEETYQDEILQEIKKINYAVFLKALEEVRARHADRLGVYD